MGKRKQRRTLTPEEVAQVGRRVEHLVDEGYDLDQVAELLGERPQIVQLHFARIVERRECLVAECDREIDELEAAWQRSKITEPPGDLALVEAWHAALGRRMRLLWLDRDVLPRQ